MKSTEIKASDMKPGFFFQFGRKVYTVITSYTDEEDNNNTLYWCKSYREDIGIMEYSHVFYFNENGDMIKRV